MTTGLQPTGSNRTNSNWTGSTSGDWIVAAVVMLWCGSLLYAGYVALTTGGDDLLSRFIGPIDDPTWMPPGQELVRIAGRHYFGDWQLVVGWGRDVNPYVLWPLAMNQLPGAYPFLAVMGAVPFSVSIWLLFGLTGGVTILASFLLLSRFAFAQRVILTVVLFGSSIGMLFSLGRGAMQGLVMGFVALSLALCYRRKPKSDGLPALALAVAIVMKPYLVILLLWPALERRWRLVIFAVGIAGATSIFGFALFPGGLVTTVSGFLRGLTPYAAGDMPYLMGGAVSLVGLLLSGLRMTAGPAQVLHILEGAPPILMWVPGVAWLLGLVAIFYLRALPRWTFVVLLLASTQLVLPTAQVYTMVWAPWAVIVILLGLAQNQTFGIESRRWSSSDIRIVGATCSLVTIAAVLVSLVLIPRNVTGALGWPVPLTVILSPAMLAGAFIVCLFGSAYIWLRSRTAGQR